MLKLAVALLLFGCFGLLMARITARENNPYSASAEVLHDQVILCQVQVSATNACVQAEAKWKQMLKQRGY